MTKQKERSSDGATRREDDSQGRGLAGGGGVGGSNSECGRAATSGGSSGAKSEVPSVSFTVVSESGRKSA